MQQFYIRASGIDVSDSLKANDFTSDIVSKFDQFMEDTVKPLTIILLNLLDRDGGLFNVKSSTTNSGL